MPEHLPRPPWRMIVSGPSMSGKTRHVLDLLTELARHKEGRFDTVLVCCPKVSLDQDDYKDLKKRLEKHGTEMLVHEGLPSESKTDELFKWLKERSDADKTTLVILDDVGALIPKSRFAMELATVACHHLKTSLMLILQRLMTSDVGRTIRLNSDYVCAFSNPADTQALRAYLMQLEPEKERWQALMQASRSAHSKQFRPFIVSHKDRKINPDKPALHYRVGDWSQGWCPPWAVAESSDSSSSDEDE